MWPWGRGGVPPRRTFRKAPRPKTWDKSKVKVVRSGNGQRKYLEERFSDFRREENRKTPWAREFHRNQL